MARCMISSMIYYFALCLVLASASIIPLATENVVLTDELAASIHQLNEAIHDSTPDTVTTDPVDDSLPDPQLDSVQDSPPDPDTVKTEPDQDPLPHPDIVQHDQEQDSDTVQTGPVDDSPPNSDTVTDSPQDLDTVQPDSVPDLIPDSDTVPSDLECLMSDGSQPNWHDDTCQSYTVCQDFVPTLHSCPDGQVFGVLEGGCTARSILSCGMGNGAFKVADEAISFLRGTIRKVSSTRVKRSSQQTDEQLTEEEDLIMVPLPYAVCELLSEDVEYLNFLESSINKMTSVKGGSGIPLISLYCEDVDIYGDNDDIGNDDDDDAEDHDKKEDHDDDADDHDKKEDHDDDADDHDKKEDHDDDADDHDKKEDHDDDDNGSEEKENEGHDLSSSEHGSDGHGTTSLKPH